MQLKRQVIADLDRQKSGCSPHEVIFRAQLPDAQECRQSGEVSFDYGLRWADSFDLIYRSHKDAAP